MHDRNIDLETERKTLSRPYMYLVNYFMYRDTKPDRRSWEQQCAITMSQWPSFAKSRSCHNTLSGPYLGYCFKNWKPNKEKQHGQREFLYWGSIHFSCTDFLYYLVKSSLSIYFIEVRLKVWVIIGEFVYLVVLVCTID